MFEKMIKTRGENSLVSQNFELETREGTRNTRIKLEFLVKYSFFLVKCDRDNATEFPQQ